MPGNRIICEETGGKLVALVRRARSYSQAKGEAG
jgi:hypothetical protein